MFNKFAVKAKAKLIKNAKLKTLRLVVAFNVYETQKVFGKTVWKFPVQAKCAYVSGDLQAEDVLNAVACAKQAIGADIEFV
jgi:hypothetical protein